MSQYRAYFSPGGVDSSGAFVLNSVKLRAPFSFREIKHPTKLVWNYGFSADFDFWTKSEELKQNVDREDVIDLFGRQNGLFDYRFYDPSQVSIVWLQKMHVNVSRCGVHQCLSEIFEFWEWWSLKKRPGTAPRPIDRPFGGDDNVREIRWATDNHNFDYRWFCDCTWKVRVKSSIGLVLNSADDWFGVAADPKPIKLPSGMPDKPTGIARFWPRFEGSAVKWGYDVECVGGTCRSENEFGFTK